MERREDAIKEPTDEEIYSSEIFFTELQDALEHYSNRLPEGRFHTVTIRTNEEGNPDLEIVGNTRFPALDDLPEHFERLKFAGRKLDKIPREFWNDFYQAQLKHTKPIPYIPMQIVLWGMSEKDRSFEKNAIMYENPLLRFSWADSKNPDNERDDAEQCKRILYTYRTLKDEINKTTTSEQPTH